MNIKTIALILISLAMIYSCRLKNENDDEEISHETDTFVYRLNDTVTTHEPNEQDKKQDSVTSKSMRKLQVDSQLTSASNLIAGHQTVEKFSAQKEKYHEIHRGMINQIWKKIDQTNLQPIKKWRDANNISEMSDTMTLLYPFSGPDFLYAHTFFPNCRNYILIGLERPGTLPDYQEMKDDEFDAYFGQLRLSLNYFNKVGYFTTNQMRNHFSKNDLNGTIHLILLYLAKTNHSIIKLSHVYIDSFGKVLTNNDNKKKLIYGIKIDFTDDLAMTEQSVYYFRFNLSDENMKAKNEFITFLSHFNEKITYLKSASYILHNSKFSEMRKLILKQSVKILQDDSGIPYYQLNGNGNFDIKVFGTYTKTIKDFKNHFQNELKKELDRQGNPKLGFTLGYNSWHGETLLMYARSKNYNEETQQIAEVDKQKQKSIQKDDTTETKEQKSDTKIGKINVYYKVQFLMSYDELPKNSKEFKGLKNVEFYKDGKIYKYTFGKERNINSCGKWLEQARSKSFSDAFVVAFNNNQRISITEAKKMAGK